MIDNDYFKVKDYSDHQLSDFIDKRISQNGDCVIYNLYYQGNDGFYQNRYYRRSVYRKDGIYYSLIKSKVDENDQVFELVTTLYDGAKDQINKLLQLTRDRLLVLSQRNNRPL